MTPSINIVVEGVTDECIVRKICTVQGLAVDDVYGKRGKDYINQKISGFSRAAEYSNWLVLRDMDHDSECPPELKRCLLPSVSGRLILAIAVREAEAWLLSDRDMFSRFFGVPKRGIPPNPELLESPKDIVVSLAARSRKRDIIADMVPRRGSGRRVGPAYTSCLCEFAIGPWRPEIAAMVSPSLKYLMDKLKALSGTR